MDLSIVIVNWNTRELLAACLASVFSNLGLLEAEVLVVDNASGDGSADMVAQRFPGVRLVRNVDNRGFAAANNQAFRLARGRHLLLLNSDTLVHGEVLAASVRYLDARPEVGAMGCRVENADGSTQFTCSEFPSFANLLLQTLGLNRCTQGPALLRRYQMLDWDRDDERDVEVISGCYLMVRAEVIEAVGALDEAFFCYGEETDWCRRIAAAGWALRFAPVGRITHFGSGTTRSLNHRRDLMLTEGTVRLHRKHRGLIGGLVVWSLLLTFNVSRAGLWTLGQLAGRADCRDRARHFRAVLRHWSAAWPRSAAAWRG
ncbi:MAG: glycosyltransferase family 2 protein [Pseudomonadales bacterium]|nr:glycosyltransferase family 2 protein [Pseudomonadales bacterium]